MRKLIPRAFNVSLDGVSADFGSDYLNWCMNGIDPRVEQDASQYHLGADESLLDLVSSTVLGNGSLELEYRRRR